MTEHLNKRFKEILTAMQDPNIDPDSIVFHSIRHTSAGVKLRISKGDLKAVQGDGGWNTADMITKRYAHILDEDRRLLAEEMEDQFYQKTNNQPEELQEKKVAAIDTDALVSAIVNNPELLIKVLQSVQSANKV